MEICRCILSLVKKRCDMCITHERGIVLDKVVSKRLTQADAGKELDLSIRQVRRLMQAYIQHGVAGLMSHKKGACGRKKYHETFKAECLGLVKEYYYDFKPTFAAEKLLENHNINVSKETLRVWMIEEGLWSAEKTKALKVHPPRARRSCVGELIQMDGSIHPCLKKEVQSPRCCFVLMMPPVESWQCILLTLRPHLMTSIS